MINKTSKALLIFFLLLQSCSGNRFKDNEIAYVFSLGIAGYNESSFCIKNVPNFADKYKNGIRPSRTCDRYKYYTCHIKHYCNGDKTCEEEAAQYWTPLWDNAHGDLEKRVSITKKVCDKEQQRNSGSNLEVQSQNKNSSQNSNNSNSVSKYD